MRLAFVIVVLGTGLPASALGLATKLGTAACSTDPNEFAPLLKEVSAAKDRLSSSETKVKAVLKEAARTEATLESLETKREDVAQEAAVESRTLANELGELQALRQQTSKLRQRVHAERVYLDNCVDQLGHERAFLMTRRDRLNQESTRIRNMELENARLHRSVDSWDSYRMRREDMNLRRAQRKHDKELAAVEQQARDLEHATGSLQAHVQHMRRDQEDLRSAELNLQSKEHPVLQRQARVGHLEEELTRLEAQVNNNIQLNNEMGKKVKQSRADWAEASRQAIAHHSSTLNRVHEEFQERDRLASERKAAINALANDLKDQTGVLNGVKSELGTADASITTLRGAIQDTQDQLKACQDKRLHEHLADEMDNFSDALPTEPEPPSQDEVFIKKVGDLADSMAEPDSMAESSQLSSTEPSDVGPEPSDDPLDKIGQLAELLKL